MAPKRIPGNAALNWLLMAAAFTPGAANRWKGNAKFAVPYLAWGLKSPNTFFLKADPSVVVDLEMFGAVQDSGKN
jgi:hypothetical protein